MIIRRIHEISNYLELAQNSYPDLMQLMARFLSDLGPIWQVWYCMLQRTPENKLLYLRGKSI